MFCSELHRTLSGHPAFQDSIVTGDDVELTWAVHDSRAVEPGALFCCVSGAAHDGHDHAPAAVAAGAAALLCERPLGLGVPEIQVRSVRDAMGPAAATLAGNPSRKLRIIGVTGTNGKTTTVQLLRSILEAAGIRTEIIGTLTGARTTPEAPELQRLLADFVAAGVEAVAMEVSSHALELHRVDGTTFAVVVFTNLSRDHLDFHVDMAAYFAAKARLIDASFAARAVVNLDDPHGRLLRDTASIPVEGYGLDDASDLRLTPSGSTFRWRGAEVHVGLPGRFNVSNALAAATAAAAIGIEPTTVAAGLDDAGVVPGRFERIDEGQPFLAAVDFAHTPDGVEKLLETGRELAGDHRVIVVFGAGGDRDATKRAPMGEVAARLADIVVLTNDNPRHEDPATILDEIERGMDAPVDLHVEADRRAAISLAVSLAADGDVMLVAGKGHENTQTIGDTVNHFDDREELRGALRGRWGAAS
jgi:UDP-N-acetylmuramoyl-L-alanyl-D-glutamate--2,6-diaminopimelate ligase